MGGKKGKQKKGSLEMLSQKDLEERDEKVKGLYAAHQLQHNSGLLFVVEAACCLFLLPAKSSAQTKCHFPFCVKNSPGDMGILLSTGVSSKNEK